MKRNVPGSPQWQHSRLLAGGDALFLELEEAISAARLSIEFEYYIFNDDAVGRRFMDALAAAAARGVNVRVLIDGVGSSGAGAAIAAELNRAGVAVKIYHPLPWLTGAYRWSLVRGGWLYKFFYLLLNINRRNHRKLCVIDDQYAWVGSINISADHLAVEAGGAGWRDYAVALRGEGVGHLRAGFDRQWLSLPARLQKGFLARHLSNRSPLARRLKNRFLVRSISEARQRVWVVSAYFAPTASLRRALLRACRRGADVRLLLPEATDVTFFPGLSQTYFQELLRSGARIFQYRGGVLHAKALLIDQLAVIGSSNLNYRSTLHDLELDVLLDEQELLEELQGVVLRDLESAAELTAAGLPDPPRLAWLWYAFRYWL